MTRIDVEWQWVFPHEFHPGSGHARAGGADRTPRMRKDGSPSFPDATKGALREAAELIAVWLGASQAGSYTDSGPWVPHSAAMHAAFVGSEFIEPRPVGTDISPRRDIHQTSIDSRSGVALAKTLRRTEVFLPGEQRFRVAVRCWVGEAELVAPVTTLLLSSVLATENVGAKSSNDWGRAVVRDIVLTHDGVAASAPDHLSPPAIEALKAALLRPAVMVQRSLAHTPSPQEATRWLQFRIEMQGAASFPEVREAGNHSATGDAIPATTLRGAIAAVLGRTPAGGSVIAQAMGETSAWTPAYPMREVCMVPAPRSYAVPKTAAGLSIAHVADRVRDEQVVGNAPRALRGAFVAVDASALDRGFGRSVSAHNAQIYYSEAARKGALYTRETIDPDQAVFVAWARVPESAVAALRALDGTALRLGDRRTVLGEARLRVGESGRPAWTARATVDDEDVHVQFISPALLRNDEGFPLRSVDVSTLLEILMLAAGASPEVTHEAKQALDVETSVMFGATTRHGNWMGRWGHGRAGAPAIAAGTIARLRFRTRDAARRVREAVHELDQVGERTHEGFGWLAIDPVWIRAKAAPGEIAAPAASLAPVTASANWPGVQVGDDVGAQIDAARAAVARLDGEARRSLRTVLRVLLQQLRDRPDTAELPVLRARWQALAALDRESAWRVLATGPVREFMDAQSGRPGVTVDAFRFALTQLLILGDEPRNVA